jgi:hypothetical protein
MLVDSGEDEWQRLHDVRLNGTVLEYVGRGKSLVDVGLAQARTPIGTRNHYFEIEVIFAFDAIGLKKEYDMCDVTQVSKNQIKKFKIVAGITA